MRTAAERSSRRRRTGNGRILQTVRAFASSPPRRNVGTATVSIGRSHNPSVRGHDDAPRRCRTPAFDSQCLFIFVSRTFTRISPFFFFSLFFFFASSSLLSNPARPAYARPFDRETRRRVAMGEREGSAATVTTCCYRARVTQYITILYYPLHGGARLLHFPYV